MWYESYSPTRTALIRVQTELLFRSVPFRSVPSPLPQQKRNAVTTTPRTPPGRAPSGPVRPDHCGARGTAFLRRGAVVLLPRLVDFKPPFGRTVVNSQHQRRGSLLLIFRFGGLANKKKGGASSFVKARDAMSCVCPASIDVVHQLFLCSVVLTVLFVAHTRCTVLSPVGLHGQFGCVVSWPRGPTRPCQHHVAQAANGPSSSERPSRRRDCRERVGAEPPKNRQGKRNLYSGYEPLSGTHSVAPSHILRKFDTRYNRLR